MDIYSILNITSMENITIMDYGFLFKTLWNIIHYILRVLYYNNIYNNIIDLVDFAVAKI